MGYEYLEIEDGEDPPCRECDDEQTHVIIGQNRDTIERLRDLVWKNRGVIDFTGFEDIEQGIDRALHG
jgi:hypothetical protein